jgi:hypothetical protein
MPVDEQHLRHAAEKDLGVAEARESLDRHLADRELVARLASRDFVGPGWDRVLAPELARYGVSVLTAWILTGMIFVRCQEKQLNLAPPHRPLAREEAGDLARMTVAYALPAFRVRALVNGGWRPDGGASLASWFVGSCVYAFPNLWRAWRSEQNRWDMAHARALEVGSTLPPASDPAIEVTARAQVLAVLAGMGEDDRTIAALAADGHTQQEIGEILGLSARAVEGRMRRIRRRYRQGE